MARLSGAKRQCVRPLNSVVSRHEISSVVHRNARDGCECSVVSAGGPGRIGNASSQRSALRRAKARPSGLLPGGVRGGRRSCAGRTLTKRHSPRTISGGVPFFPSRRQTPLGPPGTPDQRGGRPVPSVDRPRIFVSLRIPTFQGALGSVDNILEGAMREVMTSNNAFEPTTNHRGALCHCESASRPAAQLGRQSE